MPFEFGDFQLDDERLQLTGPGGPCPSRAAGVRRAAHLLRNRHRAVTTEELLDVVWGGRFVSASTLATRVKAARRAIGDDGRTQATIKTMHGVGYRFVADVADVAVTLDTDVPTPARPHRHLPALRSRFIGRDDDLVGVIAASVARGQERTAEAALAAYGVT